MTRLPHFCSLGLLALLTTPAIAQQASLAPRIPDGTRWEIVFQYPQSAPPSVASNPTVLDLRPARVTVDRLGGTTFERTVTVDGNVIERWRKGPIEVVYFPATNDVLHRAAGSERIALLASMDRMDFEAFEWVNPSNLTTSVEGEGGRLLSLHRMETIDPATVGELTPELEAVAPPKPVLTSAWIDSLTKRPVRWERNGEVRTYTFAEARPHPPMPGVVERLFQVNLATPPPVRRLGP